MNHKTPDMTTAEFKERIKGICGIRPANPLVTRTPNDRGFHPPKRFVPEPMPTPEQIEDALSGRKTIWNSDGTDGPVLICAP